MGNEVTLAGLISSGGDGTSGTGAANLPTGTTAQRPASASRGQLRYNTTTGAPEYYSGTSWQTVGALDGSSSGKAALKSTDILLYNPAAPDGWYWLSINGTPTQVYIDNTFSGGGWVLVGSHANGVSIPTLTFAQTTTGGTNYLASSGFTIGSSDPKSYSVLLPLRSWLYIVNSNNAGNKFIQYAANSAVGLSGTHARRSSWSWTGWSSLYAWQGISGLSNDVGGTTPGLYTYATTPYNWTTYDSDNDTYSANCAQSYNNAPWWYNACWDGNFWGGNGTGYQNNIFWTGSGADYYNYGAWYVR
jgi:hypothetical protein